MIFCRPMILSLPIIVRFLLNSWTNWNRVHRFNWSNWKIQTNAFSKFWTCRVLALYCLITFIGKRRNIFFHELILIQISVVTFFEYFTAIMHKFKTVLSFNPQLVKLKCINSFVLDELIQFLNNSIRCFILCTTLITFQYLECLWYNYKYYRTMHNYKLEQII